MLIKVPLDNRALTYIFDCLSQGRTLSSLLLHTKLEQGSIWTFLPPSVTLERAYDFTSGWFIKGSDGQVDEEARSTPLVSELVGNSLLRQQNAYFICEDASAEADFPYIRRQHNVPMLFFREEVYYFVTTQTSSADNIAAAIQKANSYLFTAITTTLPDYYTPLERNQQTNLEQLQGLANNSQYVIIGAYDGDGYIVWERKD